jgi:DNA-directed RNA polymerase II subunit RPB1
LFVRFGILSEEEVKKMSVAEINNEQGIDNRTKLPTHGGIHDPRMGTMDRSQECKTCLCDYNDCPGHFGHITLAQPVYHPGYVNHVNKILRCICFECGRLRLRDKKIRD